MSERKRVVITVNKERTDSRPWPLHLLIEDDGMRQGLPAWSLNDLAKKLREEFADHAPERDPYLEGGNA